MLAVQRTTYRCAYSHSVGAECSTNSAAIDSAASDRSYISRNVTYCIRVLVSGNTVTKCGGAHMQRGISVRLDVVNGELAVSELMSDFFQCRGHEPAQVLHDSWCRNGLGDS